MDGLEDEIVALRVARELGDRRYVNLGIGMPTLIASFISDRTKNILQIENGTLGCGRIAENEEEYDSNIIDAYGHPVVLIPGASFFDLATSFSMIRGGHIDVAVLGAYQVSEKGDLANWSLPDRGHASVGGAMDVACGAKQVWVMMKHCKPSGDPKIVKECSYPLTARNAVKWIFTNLCVIEVTSDGLLLTEVAPGVTPRDAQALTEPRLLVSKHLKEIEF
jgi:3-oxoacid CoA-transferase subunit B